jgi:hypothetical protein
VPWHPVWSFPVYIDQCAVLALITWLLASSSWAETRDVVFLLLLGALFYLSARRGGKREDHGELHHPSGMCELNRAWGAI